MKITNLISKSVEKFQRGQGMSEYLIMVGVIAVASIAVFGMFGDTVEKQVNSAASVLSGKQGVDVAPALIDQANDMNLETINP